MNKIVIDGETFNLDKKPVERWYLAMESRSGVIERGVYATLYACQNDIIRFRDGHGWKILAHQKAEFIEGSLGNFYGPLPAVIRPVQS